MKSMKLTARAAVLAFLGVGCTAAAFIGCGDDGNQNVGGNTLITTSKSSSSAHAGSSTSSESTSSASSTGGGSSSSAGGTCVATVPVSEQDFLNACNTLTCNKPTTLLSKLKADGSRPELGQPLP